MEKLNKTWIMFIAKDKITGLKIESHNIPLAEAPVFVMEHVLPTQDMYDWKVEVSCA